MNRARFLLPLLASLALSGCGDAGKPVSGGCAGDTGGQHLVVFSSDRGATAGQFDIYLYDLDALGFSLIKNINSSVADLNPTISSDGLVIAFESNRGGSGGSDILLYSRCQQELISLPGVNTSADEIEPAFTGDALKMAFVRMAAGIKHVYLVDGVGDTLLPLTGLDSAATVNDWSPSPDQTGGLIAFTSDRNGNPDIFVWDGSTKKVLNLPDLVSPGNDVEPALTPDGHYLCFASDRAGGAGGYDLYLYDLQLKAFVTLPANVNTASNERRPAISRSGDVIVFQSDRTGTGKIDLWNCRRSTASVGQGAQESSAGDDIDPSLLYP